MARKRKTFLDDIVLGVLKGTSDNVLKAFLSCLGVVAALIFVVLLVVGLVVAGL